MDDKIIRIALEAAKAVARAHKEHHQLAIDVGQENDDLGASLRIQLGAAFPPNSVLLGWLEGFWLGKLSAVDDILFRDDAGDFLTSGLVHGQRASLYIPYGAARNRGPGLYTLTMRAYCVDIRAGTSTEMGQAQYKVALPAQPPWHRVEFFWPLIKLCMAVVRVDNEILSAEIRGLREYLTAHLGLRPADMPHLRAAMKDPNLGDVGRLLAGVQLRMPILTPQDLVRLLCEVARLDGPVNVHEFGLIRQIADLLAVSPARCAELAAEPPVAASLITGRALAAIPS